MVVAELLDTGFIGEGLMASMRHASRTGLLAPDFVSIPARGFVYCQLIESEAAASMSGLRTVFQEGQESCRGASSIECVHVASQSQSAAKGIEWRGLSPTVQVLDFDFTALPGREGRRARVSLPITSEGRADAVLMW